MEYNIWDIEVKSTHYDLVNKNTGDRLYIKDVDDVFFMKELLNDYEQTGGHLSGNRVTELQFFWEKKYKKYYNKQLWLLFKEIFKQTEKTPMPTDLRLDVEFEKNRRQVVSVFYIITYSEATLRIKDILVAQYIYEVLSRQIRGREPFCRPQSSMEFNQDRKFSQDYFMRELMNQGYLNEESVVKKDIETYKKEKKDKEDEENNSESNQAKT